MKPDYYESTYDKDLEVKKEQFAAGNIGGITTLNEWVYVWIRSVLPGVVKYSTRTMYGETMERHILPHLGNLPLKSVSEQMVRDWIKELSDGSGSVNRSMKEGTVRNTLSILSGCMRDAQKYGLIDHNPCLEPSWIRPPKNLNEEKMWLDEEQLAVLMPFFTEYPLGMGYQLILYAGLFLSEAVALKWENVNLEEKMIQVSWFVADLKQSENGEALFQLEPLSGRKVRSVPIPDILNDRLKHAWQCSSQDKDSFVLDSGTGEPVKIDRLRAALVRKSRSLGLGKITPQMLRDTYAMKAVHAGATSDVIAELMGFATPQQVIRRYMSKRPADKRAVVEQMFQNCV